MKSSDTPCNYLGEGGWEPRAFPPQRHAIGGWIEPTHIQTPQPASVSHVLPAIVLNAAIHQFINLKCSAMKNNIGCLPVPIATLCSARVKLPKCSSRIDREKEISSHFVCIYFLKKKFLFLFLLLHQHSFPDTLANAKKVWFEQRLSGPEVGGIYAPSHVALGDTHKHSNAGCH